MAIRDEIEVSDTAGRTVIWIRTGAICVVVDLSITLRR